MDRLISEKDKRKRRHKKILSIGIPVVAAGTAVIAAFSFISPSMRRDSLDFAVVDKGNVEISADASGKVVPAYELTITSPVATRILEIYCHEGDVVEPGQSLLRLDLLTEETALQNLADQRMMKSLETEQTILASRTLLTDLEMNIKAKEMSVARLATETANERHLDSIGSGTGERVREAELAYETAKLELDQLRKQLNNERLSHAAARKSKELEERVVTKNLDEKRRTLDDARIKAPARSTVTFLNSSLGTSISAGERLAVLSDLSHFKIQAQIAESNADKISLGSEVNVRVGKKTLQGRVGTVSPQSNNGMISFSILLDNDSNERLRPGVRADINVLYDIREGVVRIPNGTYYHGPGNYTFFVEKGKNELERRKVILADGNFNFIEVKSGLAPGEHFVKNDLSDHHGSKRIRLR